MRGRGSTTFDELNKELLGEDQDQVTVTAMAAHSSSFRGGYGRAKPYQNNYPRGSYAGN